MLQLICSDQNIVRDEMSFSFPKNYVFFSKIERMKSDKNNYAQQ